MNYGSLKISPPTTAIISLFEKKLRKWNMRASLMFYCLVTIFLSVLSKVWSVTIAHPEVKKILRYSTSWIKWTIASYFWTLIWQKRQKGKKGKKEIRSVPHPGPYFIITRVYSTILIVMSRLLLSCWHAVMIGWCAIVGFCRSKQAMTSFFFFAFINCIQFTHL